MQKSKIECAAVKYDQDDVDFSKMGQLSDVLGLNQMEVGQVHTGLGEMAFSEQVKQVSIEPDEVHNQSRCKDKMHDEPKHLKE